MATLLVTHHACIDHDTGDLHPECGDRLRAILRVLESEEFMMLHREEAPHATREQLMRVHPLSYIERVMDAVPHDGHHHIDGDTILSPDSGEAALRAAGAVCAAVDAVARGEVRNAFCAVRPPGHHAEREQAMGFCIFNNVAVGAYHARAVHGLKRVAVLDWDVHHGNGTQHIFWEDPDMLYVSTHQWPQWPHTGAPDETGGHNNILNVPLPVRAGSDEFRQVMTDQVLPAMREFKPDMIILSCGFDAHANDPMAYLLLQVSDFVWATKEVMALADEVCDGRVVSVLEGGYDIRALAACTVGHVRALMGI